VTDPDFYEDAGVTAMRCNGRLLCKYPNSPWQDTEHRCERPLGHDDACSDGTVTWTTQ
jgi:hypothetical protein